MKIKIVMYVEGLYTARTIFLFLALESVRYIAKDMTYLKFEFCKFVGRARSMLTGLKFSINVLADFNSACTFFQISDEVQTAP